MIFFFIILAVNIIIIINEVCVGSMRPKFYLYSQRYIKYYNQVLNCLKCVIQKLILKKREY